MPRGLRVSGVLLALGLSVHPIGAAQSAVVQPSLDALLGRAATYVKQFESAFSTVVSQERYEQNVIPEGRTYIGGPRLQRRTLVSDFLLVRLPESDDWVPFRDVFEVDGKPVRDHDDRLVKLSVNAAGSSAERAADITNESARYNIGTVRTVNNPMLGFHIARAEQQRRFHFASPQPDSSDGSRTFVVEYQEQTRPTIVHGPQGRDMPMHGRLWVTAEGAIVRTEVLIDALGVAASIVTRFEHDQAFGVLIPVEMHEDYREPNGTRVTGVATYGGFRAFHVDVDFGRGQ